MWAADNIALAKIMQAFHLLPGFAENQDVFWDFKSETSVRIGDSDNRGSTVYIYIYMYKL